MKEKRRKTEIRYGEALRKAFYGRQERKGSFLSGTSPQEKLLTANLSPIWRRKWWERLFIIFTVVMEIILFNHAWVYWTEKDLPSYPQNRTVIYYGNGYMERTSSEIDPNNVGNTWIFETGIPLEGAKRLLPELPEPGYIPEGYLFHKLSISTYMSGRWTYSYIYITSEWDRLEIYQEKGAEAVVLWDGPESEKHMILEGIKKDIS